jgi:ADP-ribosyl-[dinitrogen reductase] hydrolase
MIQEINRAGQYIGSLLGLALGDALGTTLEFKKRGTFDPITDIVGGGPYHLQPGEWTDETSMAMCLAESLIASKGFNAIDQMNRYLDWHENGYWSSRDFCFGISNNMRDALLTFKKDKTNPFCGSTDSDKADNDSLKRIAPIALFFLKNPDDALKYSIESSRTTHASKESLDACYLFTNIMIGVLRGEEKNKVLSPNYSCTPDYTKSYTFSDEINDIANAKYKQKPEFFIKSGNKASESLEAALWSFHNSKSFKEGALLAANLGGYADSTTAIYGQLAGAFYGIDGFPDNWLRRLSYRKNIEQLAEKLWLQSLR